MALCSVYATDILCKLVQDFLCILLSILFLLFHQGKSFGHFIHLTHFPRFGISVGLINGHPEPLHGVENKMSAGTGPRTEPPDPLRELSQALGEMVL